MRGRAFGGCPLLGAGVAVFGTRWSLIEFNVSGLCLCCVSEVFKRVLMRTSKILG